FHCKEISELLDYKIFFYADPEIRLDRRIKRDQIERGYPASDVNYRWKHHVRPADLQYLDPYQDQSHLVIKNNIDYNKELNHLEELIRSKLA
ncbi:MAG: uridine kinase family protein, partial [Flavobacteriales bacterium]